MSTTDDESEKTRTLHPTLRLVGIPDDQHNVDAVYAFECAYQMGYRQTNNLVFMVKAHLGIKNVDD